MTGGIVTFWIIVGIFAVTILVKGVRIVPQAMVIVIERLGKYHKTLQSGFNLIIPIIDKPREMDIKTMRQMYDGRKISVTSRISLIDLRERSEERRVGKEV